MNSQERILSAIRCEKPDRVPVSPWGLGNINPESKLAEELITKTDIIIDAGIADNNPFLGKKAEFTKTTKGKDTITTLHTPQGDLTQVERKTEETEAVVDYFCSEYEDIDKILSIPFAPIEPNPEDYLSKKEKIGKEGLVFAGIGNAVCFPATILSPEDMCFLWMDKRELMKKLVKIGSKRINEFVKKAAAAGVEVFRIVGGEYITQQIGPEGFNELIKPYDKELCDIIHQYEGIAHYHNHGYVNNFLEDFLELGIDALDPLEIPPYGDIDLARAKKILKNEVCIIGPLDDMEVLNKKSEKEVKKLGEECIKTAGPDGYILGGTSSGTYEEPAAYNFLALVEVAKNLAD